MFSPGSEKNCVRPESCSPVRNASSRFPTGIPPLGDENQQLNRIQLAVQKYNNSNSIPVNNRSNLLSPVRHCLLKNTLRSKSYETEDGLTKNEKKSGNYYEGVGAFPTIHLRKSAIRYRPIRRFHDVKVPYPELPVNRYLSHLPELCTDLKSSTRSVLDVLQDLSAKKIEDEDDGSNKTKSKGLAGDYIMDPNAVYKPLFIQKPKINAVTTRDSMTQTLSPFRSDTPSPQIFNLNSRNDGSDPKAELRKKLAKQNNEISASLSSSITSSFAIKRKIDKVVTVRDDDQSPDLTAVKKSRIDHTIQTENGFSKTASKKNEPTKLSRKLKMIEPSSPPSSKDRLTTIFLDIRNTSPKSKIFQDSDTPKRNGISNGFATNPPTLNGSVEAEKIPEVSAEDSSKGDSGKQENERSKATFSFPVNKSDSVSPKSSTPTGQFSLPSTNFNFKPTGSASVPSKDSTDASQSSISHAAGSDEKKEAPKTFSFGTNGTNFGGFKFGSDAASPVKQNTESSGVAVNPAPVKTPPQFTFGVKSSDATPPSTRPGTQSTFATPGPSLFSFGQNGSSSSEASKTTTNSDGVSAPGINQNIQPSLFTFGQKPSAESSPLQTNTETSVATTTPSATQAPNGQTSAAPTGGLISVGQKAEAVSTTAASATEQKAQFTFTFGQKTELSKTPESGQKNLFTFGQKPAPETSQANAVAVSNQTPASPPVFGQTNVTQPAVSFGSSTFGGFGTPTTTSTNAPSSFGGSNTQTPLLGTAVQPNTSAVANTSALLFGASSTAAPTFGASTTTTPAFSASATTTTPAFGASATTITPAFGAPATTTSTFGASTTTTTPSFGASTTNALSFGASTTSTPSFGAPTTTTPSFVASTTTTSAFGASATTASTFGPSTTAPPAFGASGTTTSSFGASSTQTTFKFGAGSTQTTAFGAPSSGSDATTKQSAPAFGLNTNQLAPALGASNGAQPTQVFGAATTQSAPAFGVSSASAFGASTTSASAPAFGTTTSASTPLFGASSSTLSLPSFGTPTTQNAFGAPTAQTTSVFGASTSQSIPAFGTSSVSAFGGTSTVQSTSSFGSSTPTSTPAFGAPVSNGFGASSQPSSIFGAPASQSGFGTTANTSAFGTPGGFGATSSQSTTGFGTSGGTQTTSAFGAQPFGKPSGGSIFGQNTAPAFSSGNNFAPTQNIFGAKTSEKEMFGQNKVFGAQSDFQFGSTANSTGLTTSPPTTAAAPVFSFGGGGGGASNTFSFSGNSSAGSSNAQTPFAFTPKEPFKFGASTSKENGGFGVGGSPNFNFGSQMNSAAPGPSFDFRQTQNNANPGFNFSAGSASTPSVFSFGGSGSSGGSNRSFNFGTPTPGASFGQSAPTLGVPGTFSIGSGSSQSRPRAASRLRRRP